MRKVVCLLGLVFLFSLSAAAQEVPKVDLFAGYSFVHTSPGIAFPAFTANGGVGSVALNLTNWGSLVVEVGGIHTSSIQWHRCGRDRADLHGRSQNFALSQFQILPFRPSPVWICEHEPRLQPNRDQSQHFRHESRDRARLECHAPRRNSSRPGGLFADARAHLDQPGELEQLPIFSWRSLPILIRS